MQVETSKVHYESFWLLVLIILIINITDSNDISNSNPSRLLWTHFTQQLRLKKYIVLHNTIPIWILNMILSIECSWQPHAYAGILHLTAMHTPLNFRSISAIDDFSRTINNQVFGAFVDKYLGTICNCRASLPPGVFLGYVHVPPPMKKGTLQNLDPGLWTGLVTTVTD